MEGDLSLLSIPELVQTVCLGGHSRDIQIFEGATLIGVIGVRKGQIDRCFAFGAWGEQAFYRLAQVKVGRYRVSVAEDVTTSDSSLTRYAWQELLMEAARLQDEAQYQAQQAVGSAQVIPFPTPVPQAPSEIEAPSAKATNVRLADAPLPVIEPAPMRAAAPAAIATASSSPSLASTAAPKAAAVAPPAQMEPVLARSESEELFRRATQQYLLRNLDAAEELFAAYLKLQPDDKRAQHNLERIRRKKSP